MKTKIFLLTVLLITGTTAFSTTWTVTNSGFTFTPDTLFINIGDSVNFSLESMHNAIEVNEATWMADDNTPLAGGFGTVLGGGLVLPVNLTLGIHWYVCSPHASSGMKGVIIVIDATGLNENLKQEYFSAFPNPTGNSLTIKTNMNAIGTPYDIYDQSGRQVMCGILTELTTTLQIEAWATGVYLLQFGKNKKQTIRLVKQ